jgi:dihydropteroate synthase
MTTLVTLWLNPPDSGMPLVMGILNVTPDSFSDGGQFESKDKALERALEMVEEGADIIDVGGESTRPGAQPVSAAQEIERVVGVVELIREHSAIPVSVDTSKPEVMTAAASAGASMINDVRALRSEGALPAAAATGLPVCLMHMQGEPRTMQANPEYGDVIVEVRDFLLERADVCIANGIPRQKIVLDPGFGFGKSLQHNIALLQQLGSLVDSGYPVIAGMSRKAMIGALLKDSDRDRLVGSVTLALYAWRQGAHIVRVHDVGQTVEALQVEAALISA